MRIESVKGFDLRGEDAQDVALVDHEDHLEAWPKGRVLVVVEVVPDEDTDAEKLVERVRDHVRTINAVGRERTAGQGGHPPASRRHGGGLMTIAEVFEHLALLEDVQWVMQAGGAMRAPIPGVYENGEPRINCPLGVLAHKDMIADKMDTEKFAEALGMEVEDASKLIDAADNVPPVVCDKVQPFNPRLRAGLLKAIGLDEMPEEARRRRWDRYASRCAGLAPGTVAYRTYVKLSMDERLTDESEIVAVLTEDWRVQTYRGRRVE